MLHKLKEDARPHFVIHSGQHYSESMDAIFFAEHGLADPDFRVGNMRPDVTPGEQTAEMLAGIEAVLLRERPGVVLVGGDANTNLAGALAARKLDINVCHVEAGLRSRDWRMPEEHNRVMIDHISDALCCSSERAAKTAEAEGVQGRIVVTGSTTGEALAPVVAAARRAPHPAARDIRTFALVTLHRQENVDDPAVLSGIVDGLTELPHALGGEVLWPVHPRTSKRLTEFGLRRRLDEAEGVKLLEPVGHGAFVSLMLAAAVVLTDSGGVQQEACILHVPCVTARPTTEWTETVDAGANAVVGTSPDALVAACCDMAHRARDWPDPFSVAGEEPSRAIVDVAYELLEGPAWVALPQR